MVDAPKIKILEEYTNKIRDIPVSISIRKKEDSYTYSYNISISGISRNTEIVLEEIQEQLIKLMNLENFSINEVTGETDEKFNQRATQLLEEYFPYSDEETKILLKSYLISRSLGMGYMDFLLNDSQLEEIAIDNASEPIWVYHRKWGWMKTNIYMSSEEQIKQTAARIGRNVGRQINTLNPLLDASLSTGERVNATISPITVKGNTITLRKFSEDPWTITKFIETKTISPHVAAFIWQIMQYEMSILVVGGTASGKTSMLNALSNFIPPNQRIISIEDTAELKLASFLYWVPMMTRLENAEGKGKITMEDLLVNSLRMRPDRILVGEVRKSADAETLLEAIHTGHSCYATFHANNTREAIARLTSEPVNVPKALLPAINIMLVQFRNRRTGKRRTYEVSEVLENNEFNALFKYDAKKDALIETQKSKRVMQELSMFTGLSEAELKKDQDEKKLILETMVKLKIFNIEKVGKIIADYYADKDKLLTKMNQFLKTKTKGGA
jgi:archaeal flagellar protein FlaI